MGWLRALSLGDRNGNSDSKYDGNNNDGCGGGGGSNKENDGNSNVGGVKFHFSQTPI